jgi:ppGpp synthetase/RelA/SpoT-type nucleotidyltranferase
VDNKATIIDEFLRHYEVAYDFFDQASRLAAQKLGGHLRSVGIRAIVTSRAKGITSLGARVRERSVRKKYSSADDIFNDIIDLAGVRVALYFPGDHESADHLIRKLFALERDPPLTFPLLHLRPKPGYRRRFPGYRAVHYRVRLKDEFLTAEEKRYGKTRIEIQVATVLMHSWAEVEHDLVYKPLQGQLSEEEHKILDDLNGLVLAGENALERLQKAREARGNRSFTDHYELATYLSTTSAARTGASLTGTDLGRIDLLFELLRRLGLGTPDKLAPYTQALGADLENASVVDHIIDKILEEDKDRYQIYETLLASRVLPSDRVTTSRNEGGPEAGEEVSKFLDAWVMLEHKINEMMRGAGSEKIYASRAILERLGVRDEVLLKDFERLRRTRNAVVHRLTLPTLADVRQAAKRIREISDQLERIK